MATEDRFEEAESAEALASADNVCTKCGAVSLPGAVHCHKCGHVLYATEADPDRPLKRVFTWWLLLYGVSRAYDVAVNSIAVARSVVGSDARFYFSILCALSALSLFAIAMPWRGKRWALILFIFAEIASGLWVLLIDQFVGAIFSIIAVIIMWYVSKRANFARA